MRKIDADLQKAMSVVAGALQGSGQEVEDAWSLIARDMVTDHVAARINTPEVECFVTGIENEIAHQQDRWGPDHDAGKNAFEWFWLIGYLAQKAADAAARGDIDKARHHTITTAAALANWHRHLAAPDEQSDGNRIAA